MIELPESNHLERQALKFLSGKTVKNVFNATGIHKFCWTNKELDYNTLLSGKKILDAKGHGMYLDLFFEDNCSLSINDGVNIRLYEPFSVCPEKYQLLINFTDGSFAVLTVAMYGGIWACKGIYDNKYHSGSLNSVSPLDTAFNEIYFDSLLNSIKGKNISAKAFLATEQRIPGLGNGVLQDILLLAGIHPKRKVNTLSDFLKSELYNSVKETLKEMAANNGRNTERDMLGNYGGYSTLLCKNTYSEPCPLCGEKIIKEAYLGGSVYYCKNCQPLEKGEI